MQIWLLLSFVVEQIVASYQFNTIGGFRCSKKGVGTQASILPLCLIRESARTVLRMILEVQPPITERQKLT